MAWRTCFVYKMIRRDIRVVKSVKRVRFKKKRIRPMVWRPGGFTLVFSVIDIPGAIHTPKFMRRFCESDGKAAGAHGAEEPGECEMFETAAKTDFEWFMRFG
jgi:hypothetical protein